MTYESDETKANLIKRIRAHYAIGRQFGRWMQALFEAIKAALKAAP
jgi:hypothetical protein